MNTKLHRKHKLQRNITLEYLFCAFRSFDVSGAIWVLYMVYKGLPLWQVGILEGIYHIASFLFEIPTGVAADLLGRKRVLILGRVMGVISSILMIVSQGVVGFGVSFIFCALGNNLNSGSEEALVYDTMKELGTEKGYLKVNGKMHVIIEASIGIATIVGGILAEQSYTLCYLCAVLIGEISILPAVYMEEPAYSEQKEEKVTIRGHFKKSIELIKEMPQVLKILLYYPTVAAFYVALYFYGQQFYAEFGFTKVEISIIMLMASGISCIGATSGEWFILRFGGKTKYWAALVMGGSILVTSVRNPVLSVVGFFVASFINSLLEPIGSSALNELIPSKQRATILSVDSMFFSMAMIVFFPIGGAIATKFNLHMTFRMLGLVEIAMILLIVRRKSNTTTKKHR